MRFLGCSLVVVLLVAGCAAPRSGDPEPDPGPDLSAISMDAATLVSANAEKVVFEWTGSIGPGANVNVQDLTGAARTHIDFTGIAEMGHAVRVEARWDDEDADLMVEILDSSGLVMCQDFGTSDAQGYGVPMVAPDDPVSRCSAALPPASGAAAGGVIRMVSDVSLEAETPFEATITIAPFLADAPVGMAEVIPFEAPAEDGTMLRGHIYLPEGDGPFATVLVYQPYWNAGGGQDSAGQMVEASDGRMTLDGWLGPIADAGFAVAAINTRGSGASDGCYSYMNHPVNGPDAGDVIEALAAQPWSNGNVGMYGISYPAATQFSAIAHDPPDALKAIVPMSGEWDEWNLLGRWGVAGPAAAYHPAFRDVSQGLGTDGIVFGPLNSGTVFPPTPDHWCPETVTDIYEYQELARTGDKSPFYKERDLREQLVENRVPIFATNGMTFGEGHILQFEGLWGLLHLEERRLMVGQWGHNYPEGSWQFFGTVYAVPWFDHFLRDGPAPQMDVVDFQDNTFAWHQAERWPPVGVATNLTLTQGTMTLADEADDETVSFLAATTLTYPVSCTDVPVVWRSPPLVEDVLIAGNAFLHLNITSTEDDGTMEFDVQAVAPGETCGTRIQYGLGDLRHRGGQLPAGSPFPVGTETPITLRTMPFAHVIPAGHEIHVGLGPAWGGSSLPEDTMPTIDVRLGGASSLELNVVQGELRFT